MKNTEKAKHCIVKMPIGRCSFALVEVQEDVHRELDAEIVKCCSSLEEAKVEAELLGIYGAEDETSNDEMRNEIVRAVAASGMKRTREAICKYIGIPSSIWDSRSLS